MVEVKVPVRPVMNAGKKARFRNENDSIAMTISDIFLSSVMSRFASKTTNLNLFQFIVSPAPPVVSPAGHKG